MLETQHIEPMSRRHGLSLTVMGATFMLILLGVLYWLGGRGHLVVYFLFLASLVTTLLGILKLREPVYSFSLSRDSLHFHHKIGGWSLHWSNVVRIDQPRFSVGLELTELPYIGLKIRDYDELLPLITPRLAVHLLTEQRPLLAMALRYQVVTRSQLQDWLIEDSHYRSASGRRYEGILAMLANRMSHLRQLYGYDLLVHESNLDRDTPDFVALLRRYQSANSLPPEQH
ncbi:DUF2982 domain-containing protein [Zobellella maritima]|uniref:DUF2982 domain-containing protein n=1 Tax=Zobellella maritima TaxID=2059725 RepID=UPI002FCDD89E